MSATDFDGVLARRPGVPLSESRARMRNAATMARVLVACDKLIEEAAEARISAPGVLEIREWAELAILHQVDKAGEGLAARAEKGGAGVAV